MDEFSERSDLDAAYSSVPNMGEHLADNWNISMRTRRAMPAALWTRIRTEFHAPSDFQARTVPPKFARPYTHTLSSSSVHCVDEKKDGRLQGGMFCLSHECTDKRSYAPGGGIYLWGIN